MADQPISGLPASAALDGPEKVAVVQSGATVRTTLTAIWAKARDRATHIGTQEQSTIVGLVAALAAKAADVAVVKLSGPQTIDDVKTFLDPPVVPDGSWSIADTSGLAGALNAKLSGVRVEDEGGSTVAAATALNFAGAGVTVTDAGSNEALVTIPGGGLGGIRVEDQGTSVVAAATGMNFAGAGVVVTDAGSGEALVTISGSGEQSIRVEDQAGWDPIAADNDPAFDLALAAVLAAGGGRVLLPRLLKVADLHDVGAGVDLQGLGSRQTGGASEVRCTAAGAGIRYADLVTPQSGGVSGGFRVNGNGVATAPIRLGLIVGRTFHNIDIDGSAGVGLLLQGSANSTFIEVNIQGSVTDACQVDRALGNAFFKCEFGGSSRYNLNLMSGGSALPYGQDYPLNNAFYSCIFEYHDASTLAMVHQGAGINNMLSDCILASSITPTSSGLRLLDLEKAGAPPSVDLKLRDCNLQFNFAHASTIAVRIGDGTRLILSGQNSLTQAGKGFQNDVDGVLEADRLITTSVTTLKHSTAGGEAYMRIRPDFSPTIACTSVGGVDRCIPIYVAGVFQGYVAVGQTPA